MLHKNHIDVNARVISVRKLLRYLQARSLELVPDIGALLSLPWQGETRAAMGGEGRARATIELANMQPCHAGSHAQAHSGTGTALYRYMATKKWLAGWPSN